MVKKKAAKKKVVKKKVVKKKVAAKKAAKKKVVKKKVYAKKKKVRVKAVAPRKKTKPKANQKKKAATRKARKKRVSLTSLEDTMNTIVFDTAELTAATGTSTDTVDNWVETAFSQPEPEPEPVKALPDDLIDIRIYCPDGVSINGRARFGPGLVRVPRKQAGQLLEVDRFYREKLR